jgi:hypothetical protein
MRGREGFVERSMERCRVILKWKFAWTGKLLCGSRVCGTRKAGMRWTLRTLPCVIAESDHGETGEELQEKLRTIAELKLAAEGGRGVAQGEKQGRDEEEDDDDVGFEEMGLNELQAWVMKLWVDEIEHRSCLLFEFGDLRRNEINLLNLILNSMVRWLPWRRACNGYVKLGVWGLVSM